MSDLFGRVARLTVGTTQINGVGLAGGGVRMAFRVRRSLEKAPNTGEVTVYNLADTTRRALSAEADRGRRIPLELAVGYEPDLNRGVTWAHVFAGEIRTVSHQRSGPDWITSLSSGDGDWAMRMARAAKSYREGVTAEQLVLDIAEMMGVDVGNAIEVIQRKGLRAGVKQLFASLVLSGAAAKQLDKALAGTGLDWSIQDGGLLLLGQDEVTADQAVLLSPDRGLLGSPEVGSEGMVRVRSLLQPGLIPGRAVQVSSRYVSGFFKILTASYSGDTDEGDWAADLELREVPS